MAYEDSDCACPAPTAPWREPRRHRDCPVHGNVDERIDALREARDERDGTRNGVK